MIVASTLGHAAWMASNVALAATNGLSAVFGCFYSAENSPEERAWTQVDPGAFSKDFPLCKELSLRQFGGAKRFDDIDTEQPLIEARNIVKVKLPEFAEEAPTTALPQ